MSGGDQAVAGEPAGSADARPGGDLGLSSGLGYLLPAIIGLESMGVPSPGETALVLAAVLASQGKLQIWLVILIAIVSAIVGDNIGYLLGRRVGREVLEAPGPFQRRRVMAIAAGDRFFDQYGPKAVFFGRWIALVRFAVAWLAGIDKMRFREFFVWNALGAITWASRTACSATSAARRPRTCWSSSGSARRSRWACSPSPA